MNASAQSWISRKKPVVAGIAVVALMVAVISLIPDNPAPEEMGERADRFSYAAGAGLGRHLATAFPDARVRILLRQQGQGGFSGEDLADGLEAQLGGHVKGLERVWVGHRPEPIDELGGDGQAPQMTRDDLVKALSGWERDTDLVIFLFQPPAGLLKAWTGKPALAVASTNISALFDPLEKGVITAALAARPDAKLHENGRLIDPPSNPLKAFALCFEVLTPETVGAFKDRYPYLVGGPR